MNTFKISLLLVTLASSAFALTGGDGDEEQKEKVSCAAHQETNVVQGKNESAGDFKPKKCKCLGRRSDGPLKDLCVIPCRCPGNCGND